jgi:squalene-associated FAD-dependent desaturase
LGRLDPDDVALDDVTFGEWLRDNHQSPEAIDSFWELFALPSLNVHADDASLALAAMVFRTALLTQRDAADIGYARVPLGELHGEAAMRALRDAGATVHTRARVTAIEPAPRRHRVEFSGGCLEADAVVVAVPHTAAAPLLPREANIDAARLDALGRSPIVNVHVLYDRTVMDVPFAAGISTPVQWVFDRTEASGLDRGQYLAVSLSGATAELTEPATALRDRFLPALAALFPRAERAQVVDCFVTRDPAATFRQAAGSRRFRAATRTGAPRLYLAGAWTDTGWPATMEGAVRSGHAAAHAALVDLGNSHNSYDEEAAA